eukprot:2086164-Prorocentrum_lima.AAC.1
MVGWVGWLGGWAVQRLECRNRLTSGLNAEGSHENARRCWGSVSLRQESVADISGGASRTKRC